MGGKLDQTQNNYDRIEAVKCIGEVRLDTQTDQIDDHFEGEKDREDDIGPILDVAKPVRLAMVLRRHRHRVKKDEDDHDGL